jgi:chaperonin GroEL
MKEKKARVEDALHATRAAVEEGIVPGGGVAYIRTIKALDKMNLEGDEKVGAKIVRKALEEPIRMIAENGGVEGSIVIDKVMAKEGNYGYNAETDEYGDMMKFGVIDPTKVTRTALENAASIAGLLLTTEAIVTDKPEKDKAMPQMPPGGGMGDMY